MSRSHLSFILPVSLSLLSCAALARVDAPRWEDITRKVEHALSRGGDLSTVLRSELPSLVSLLEADASDTSWLPYWGRSLNFDEGARAEIVEPRVLDSLVEILAGPARDGRIMHAGIEHSYGYLFSNLKTPYGYKRERWTDQQIDQGLELPVPVLDLTRKDGGFLGTLTYLMGKLALQDSPAFVQWMTGQPRSIDPHFFAWPRSELQWDRVSERFQIGNRQIEIRTDVVPLRASSFLLIYSIADSATEGGPVLITAFPIDARSARQTLDETKLGAGQEIKTRYNAFVAGVTGTTQRGTRTLERMRAR